MNLIDWQELYAANRAVIEGRGGPGHARPAPHPPAASPRALPSRSPVQPSGGRWERVVVTAGGRSRAVYVHAPAGIGDGAPLVVMLHGCTQSPGSFAAGTAMNAAAERHGFVVAYPEQTREDNQQGCWNWFVSAHQARDGGEPASIAAGVRKVIERWSIDPARVHVAGLSAGGAMASIMAATHPDLFAAVAVHSGLAFRSARNLPAATAAMRRGGDDPVAMGRAAHAAMGAAAHPLPALVVHGDADQIVCPVNGEQVARQWLETNRLASGAALDFARPAEMSRDHEGGRATRTRRWTDGEGRVLTELVEVEGLGHAWSGGTAGGSYTDPRGPSATDLIWTFFRRVSDRG